MHVLFIILEQARRRAMAEQSFAYINSPEGKAAAEELNRLRAACEAAEATYLANQTRRDAERSAEAREFGDYRSDAEMSAHYGEGRA